MWPRDRVISGYILEFFAGDMVPDWQVIGPALKEHKIRQLSGFEIFPDGFLEIVFSKSKLLKTLIPDFRLEHYQMIQVF